MDDLADNAGIYLCISRRGVGGLRLAGVHAGYARGGTTTIISPHTRWAKIGAHTVLISLSTMPKRQNYIRLSLIAFVIAFAFVVGLVKCFVGTYYVAVSCCAIVMLLLLFNDEPIVAPLNLALLAYLLWFLGRAVVISIRPEHIRFTSLGTNPDRWRYLNISLVYTILWLFMMVTMYNSSFSKKLSSKLSDIDWLNRPWRGYVYQKAYIIYLLGLIGQVYLLLAGRYIGIVQAQAYHTSLAYTSGYNPIDILLGTVLPMLSEFGFIVLSILYIERRGSKGIFLFAIILCLELFLAFIGSTRGAFINIGLVILLCLHRYRPKMFKLSLFLSPLAIAIIFLTANSYRYYVSFLGYERDFKFNLSFLLEHITLSLNYLSQSLVDFFRDPIYYLIDTVWARFAGVDRFAASLISLRERSASFVWGQTIVQGMLSGFPRIIWPSRPNMNLGYWFPVNYLGMSPDRSTVIPMARIIECYINFGVLGISLGGAAMGIALRLVAGLMKSRYHTGMLLFIYLTLRVVLVIEKPLASLFVFWKPLIFMFGIFFFFSFPRHEDHPVST